ncbi:MAG: aminotransferase class V-fold PLP-dependent enzyme [Clostridiales bacterium]|nr:aminotransferase class V-fold PLP-dependent enzyme [Clostridiales bacterium]
MTYLDYAASSPTDPEVLQAFQEACLRFPGNPNSSHRLGRQAKDSIRESRAKIADLLGVMEEEVIFTSGATESNNLAVKGQALRNRNWGNQVLFTHLEHSSVTGPIQELSEAGFRTEPVSLLPDGRIDLSDLSRLAGDGLVLAAFSMVDAELGVLQDTKSISKILEKSPKCAFLCDVTQAVGKIPLDLSDVGLASLSCHKFGGLHGSGILVKKERVSISAQITGGASTTSFRSGTPAAGMAAACAFALEKSISNVDANKMKVENLRSRLLAGLAKAGLVLNSSACSIGAITNFSTGKIQASDLAELLDDKGFLVSTKSACCPPNAMSRAVYAVTGDRRRSMNTIRVSLSHLSEEKDIDDFLHALSQCTSALSSSGGRIKR